MQDEELGFMDEQIHDEEEETETEEKDEEGRPIRKKR